MRPLLLSCFLFPTFLATAQTGTYKTWVAQADSLYQAGAFAASADAYSKAFETFGWRGYAEHRYAAARAWAMAGGADSAFFQLNRLVEKAQFREVESLETEPAFEHLQSDFRWKRLLAQIRMRIEQEKSQRNSPLAVELEGIRHLDQWYRVKMDSVLAATGSRQSEGYQKFTRAWAQQDSLNCQRVCEIIDQNGWLGPAEVGEMASGALYLVIQHAPLAVQEKYFPLMQKAVAEGKASASNLAYLEDRILMRQGKPQRYGSQLRTDNEIGELRLYLVEDPANLDKRRASVGLGPIAQYLEQTGGVWKQ